MKTPLAWNTLAWIADYLGERTDRRWTVPEVLDLALREHAERPGERPDPRPTRLSAALPADANFRRVGFKHMRDEAGLGYLYPVDGPTQRIPIVALNFESVVELMAACRTTLAFFDPTLGPDTDLSEPASTLRVRIDPPGVIPLDSVGAFSEDVETLARFAGANDAPEKPEPVAPKRARSDLLAVEIETAIRDLGNAPTAAAIMRHLKTFAGKAGSCIVKAVAEGVKWRNARGREITFDVDALRKRLDRRATRARK